MGYFVAANEVPVPVELHAGQRQWGCPGPGPLPPGSHYPPHPPPLASPSLTWGGIPHQAVVGALSWSHPGCIFHIASKKPADDYKLMKLPPHNLSFTPGQIRVKTGTKRNLFTVLLQSETRPMRGGNARTSDLMGWPSGLCLPSFLPLVRCQQTIASEQASVDLWHQLSSPPQSLSLPPSLPPSLSFSPSLSPPLSLRLIISCYI